MGKQKKMVSVKDIVTYLCEITEKSVSNNKENNIQVIEGIGECVINGTKYQAQILLEPSESKWVSQDETTIRANYGDK